MTKIKRMMMKLMMTTMMMMMTCPSEYQHVLTEWQALLAQTDD